MAKRTTITNQGLSLLASSSKATGQYYWLGYYALAYVPNLWKSDEVSLPEDGCGNANTGWVGSVPIESTDIDKVTASMTKLTEYGDILYNIWQGDLNGTGYINGQSDGSAGGNLFSLGYYNTNIKKHYRYVLDENGNNTLVGWINDPSSSEGLMVGKHIYKGTDGFNSSTMPIPAPVYYLGEVTGKKSVDSYFDGTPTFEDEYENGATVHPSIEVQLHTSTLNIPKVSVDYRGYIDSQGNSGNFNYGSVPSTPYIISGTYFDSLEIPYPISNEFSEISWFAGDQTYLVSGSTIYVDSYDGNAIYSDEFWKLHTISNFNRFHAPVNSIGHVLTSDLSNRNMAKSSKYFPISNYKVINTESGYTSTSEYVEVATGIKLSIDIDITPRTLNRGFSDGSDYNETENIEFFDKYSNPANESLTDVTDEFGGNIYNSTHTSFKFNRIGIYAVPLRRDACVLDQGFGNISVGENVELSFQIDPNEDPVLFAVIDWDNTVYMSDTGDGINQFKAEFDINLQSPEGVEDTALIRNSTIFYNLYEDDALTWYQNQLIATASTSNAITEIGLEVAHIKNTSSASACCPSPDLSGKYALLNHTHDLLRNIKDAQNKFNNGIRGIVSAKEGIILDDIVYELGNAAITFGTETAAFGDNSTVSGGYGSWVGIESPRSFIGSGNYNIIMGSSNDSMIGSGAANYISGSSYSGIIAGSGNTLSNGSNNFIGSGAANYVESSSYASISSGDHCQIYDSSNSFIGAGASNYITSSMNSFIGAGGRSENPNQITGSDYACIVSGMGNQITSFSFHSSIIGGFANEITNSSPYAIISGGNGNTINQSNGAFIGSGDTHKIIQSNKGFIGAGAGNTLDNALYSGIVSGSTNYIGNTQSSVIVSGEQHYIIGASTRSVIVGGLTNTINASDNAFIGSGYNCYIDSSPQSSIISGEHNRIEVTSNDSSIVSGSYNQISRSLHSLISGGSYNTISAISNKSSIINGYINSITGSLNSVILSGEANAINDSNYVAIIGGMNNYIGGASYATAMGKDVNITTRGEVSHSSGVIADGIYNKHSFIMMSGVTNSSTHSVEMSIGGSNSYPRLGMGQGFAGTITVVGYLSDIFGVSNADGMYHEIHSVSGIRMRSGVVDYTTPNYTEFDRTASGTYPSVDDTKRILSDGADLTSLVTSATATGTQLTINMTSTAYVSINDYVRVSDAGSVCTGTFQVITVEGGYIVCQLINAVAITGTVIITDLNRQTMSSASLPHLPSIVDTVIDYRYSFSDVYNGMGSCYKPTSVYDTTAVNYPVVDFYVDVNGYVHVSVDAENIYTQLNDEDPPVSSQPIYWSVTCDFTFISV